MQGILFPGVKYMERDKIINDIRIISQFQNLSFDELDAISIVCVKKNYLKNEILFSEGEKANSVYLLISGSVEIWKDFQSDKKDLLAVQNPGNIVGEMAVIDELTRSATVLAGNEVEAYTISRDDFINLLQRLPELSFEFMKSISMLVRNSNQNFVNELRNKNMKLEKTNKKILKIQGELVQKERLSIVGQFASMILHDIRNPVSVIKGYSDILQIKNTEPEKVKNYAKAIQKEALSLNALAGEMLDYSRGDIRLNLSIIELDKLVDEVLSNIRKKVLDSNIELNSSVNYTGPVLLDYDRIYRVLLNLCDNSRKALYEGGKISIEINGNSSSFEIKVIDNGDGIRLELLDKVFDPFTSFSRSGGTGLGMLIVKNIIEAHEGTVSVKSEEHLGTVVTIKLPLRN